MRITYLLFLFIIIPRVEAQTSTLVLADSLFAIGNYQKAIQLYKNQATISATVYQKIASAEKTRGNLTQALSAYKKAIAQEPNLLIAKANYGKLLRQTYQYKKADSVYTELIQKHPKNPDFHYQMGIVKQRLKDTTAVHYFQKTIQLDSFHQNALYYLAKHFYTKKNFSKTEKLTQKVLQKNNLNLKINLLSAQNAYTQKHYKTAVKRYLNVLNLGYKSATVYEKLGAACYQESQIKKAIGFYQKAIRLDPQKASAHASLGKLYLLHEKPKKAEEHLLLALLLSKPQLDELYQSLGLTYKLQKDYKKALPYFKLALEENPNKIRSQFELAVAADNYYAELDTRLSYYKLFLNKFELNSKATYYTSLAKRRISDIKQEKHLGKGK
ncbi:tetratricopeptide repeat protein [Haloflavibacter putidus]|uniref:Tetratricopeptide repeat protein n=1 Tax=Haloflavibacter putidus TaxID=2576776 RepID=A0A507ZCF3_9FLAO|nr:tetratricopeptide repeat protein [Haloflavibacter putidus]TQD34799.1 tetratricopeptide repeat protein [Haloflavibacter putidus]